MYMPTIICNSRLFVKAYYYIYMPTLFADFMTSYNESTTYLKGSGKVRQGGHPDKLNREFRRGIGVGVAVEDMRHGVEVQIAGTGKDAGERPPDHRSGERLVAGERRVGIECSQVELVRTSQV